MRGRGSTGTAGLVCAAVLALGAPAAAKTISITIGQQAEIRGGTLVVKTHIGNTGDESAKSVGTTLRFGEGTAKGKRHDDLPPNGSYDEELSVPTGTLGEGRWPYSIAVDYADANLYPFQALLVTTTVVGNPPPPKVSVPEIKSEGISDSGSLTIKFKNLSAAERDATYRV